MGHPQTRARRRQKEIQSRGELAEFDQVLAGLIRRDQIDSERATAPLFRELAEDTAIAAADTLLLTVPNQLGVDYNAHVIDSVLRHVAPALGWR